MSNKLTEKKLDEMIDEILDKKLYPQPEQPPQTGLEGLRQAALGWGRKKKGIGVPRLPSILQQ